MRIKHRGRRRACAAIISAAAAVGLALAGIGTAAAPDARADGYLTAYEELIGDDSWPATCVVFDEMFTGRVYNDTAVALGVSEALANTYALSLDNSIDVVNYQVQVYCPRHWDNLVAIGENARGGGSPGDLLA